METRKRSILKAVIWNFVGLAVMAIVGVAFTGSLALGGGMAVVNATVGLTTYFAYERIWARIGWGRHA